MKLAITGHRPHKLNNEYDLDGPFSTHIRESLRKYIVKHSPSLMMCGAAIGVDIIFAELAIEHEIPLTCYIPFVGQENMWPKESKERYYDIINHDRTNVIIVCSGGFSMGKFQVRNERMVDDCDSLVAVWDRHKSGGTWNCIRYAQRVQKPTHIIDVYK